MVIETYFYDTYALIEIIKGNFNYSKYINFKAVLTKLNLLELYCYLLKNYGEEKANHYYNLYSRDCMDFDDDVIKGSVKFWISMRKNNKKPSYTDCIGYMMAKRLNIKFLTGDKEFKNLQNVEFVK